MLAAFDDEEGGEPGGPSASITPAPVVSSTTGPTTAATKSGTLADDMIFDEMLAHLGKIDVGKRDRQRCRAGVLGVEVEVAEQSSSRVETSDGAPTAQDHRRFSLVTMDQALPKFEPFPGGATAVCEALGLVSGAGPGSLGGQGEENSDCPAVSGVGTLADDMNFDEMFVLFFEEVRDAPEGPMSVVETREQHAPVNADVGIKTASEEGRATTSVPGPGARADGTSQHPAPLHPVPVKDAAETVLAESRKNPRASSPPPVPVKNAAALPTTPNRSITTPSSSSFGGDALADDMTFDEMFVLFFEEVRDAPGPREAEVRVFFS